MNKEVLIQSGIGLSSHSKFLEVTRQLRLTRMKNIESPEVNDQIDLLESRLTDLSEEIAGNKGMLDTCQGNPLWKLWSDTWAVLGSARNNGRYEEEETAWNELKNIARKMDLQARFSAN